MVDCFCLRTFRSRLRKKAVLLCSLGIAKNHSLFNNFPNVFPLLVQLSCSAKLLDTSFYVQSSLYLILCLYDHFEKHLASLLPQFAKALGHPQICAGPLEPSPRAPAADLVLQHCDDVTAEEYTFLLIDSMAFKNFLYFTIRPSRLRLKEPPIKPSLIGPRKFQGPQTRPKYMLWARSETTVVRCSMLRFHLASL